MGKLGLLALVSSLALGVPRVSRADDTNPDKQGAERLPKPNDPHARELLAEGIGHYRAREWTEAVAAFKQGLRIEPNALFFYNLGQCSRSLGEYEDAIWYFERFLARAQLDGDDPLRARVDAFISQMKSELQHQGKTLEPTEPLSGDEIEPPRSRGRAPAAASAQSSTPTTSTPSIALHTRRHEPWFADWSGWTITGLGAAAGGVGIALLANAASIDDQGNREPIESKAHDLHDQATTRRITGAAVGAAGVGLLVAGIIKLALTPDDDERVSWHLGASRNGVLVFGSF
ncbi:MAG TPA: tetratricopeptide repeat protein [Kofleriaceae bacterium]|jgi:tetratricopeptide (TPR) repeat protein